MEQLKEIKSVAIVPFTLMSSSISAVLGLIYAIILILILGVVSVFLPAEASLISSLMATMAVALILVLPVGSFLFSVVSSFVTALLYNLLVPKIGGIKLGMVEMKEVRSIPVIPVSLMLSLIYTILTFLVMLVVAPIVAVSLQGAALISISATAATGLEGLSALGIIGIIIMVIGVPILVLICSFIFSAISAILYNILAPKIGGVRLKFSSKTGNMFEIKKNTPITPGHNNHRGANHCKLHIRHTRLNQLLYRWKFRRRIRLLLREHCGVINIHIHNLLHNGSPVQLYEA